MSRVLCFSYERLFYPDESLSGAGYRLWSIAKYLKEKGQDVTIAERNHDEDYEKDSIRFLSWDALRLKDIKKEFDCAVVPLSAYSNEYFSKIRKIPTLVDLSTPLPIEAQLHSLGEKDEFFVHHGLSPLYFSLILGDRLICSTKSQKMYYSGMLHLLGEKLTSDSVLVAPLAPEIQGYQAGDRKIIDVGRKKLLLWLGSIFSWYDYETPILAMKKVKNAHLVFAGALNPNVTGLTKKNYEAAKKFAKDIGVLGKNVSFIDWVPYGDVNDLCNQADAAVTCSQVTPESELSYRLRYTDYLSARLPLISTGNDDFSEMISKNGLGMTAPPKDPGRLAAAITEVLDKREMYSANIDSFIKDGFNRDDCFMPILEFCLTPKFKSGSARLEFYNIIDAQKERIKDLEFLRDDKLATNSMLTEEIKKYEARFSDVLEDKKASDKELKQNIASLNEVISEQNGMLKRQAEFSGRFRGSIVYPLYRISSAIGKTYLGKLLVKILK